MFKIVRPGLGAILTITCLLVSVSISRVHAQDVSFKGQVIRIIVTSSAPNSYDTRARIMARHIGHLLPGNPTVVVDNMPGAGSIVAMNYLYNVAPKDGTVVAVTQRTTFTAPFFTPNGIRFDLDKLNWVGNFGSDNGVLVTWRDTPIKTTADIFSHEMIVGATGQSTLPTIANALIGTKFKVIMGYSSTAEMGLAMERGEIMGPGEWSWSDLKATKPDWLRDNKVRILLQSGLRRAPDLPDVPLVTEFAKNEQDADILRLFVVQRELAYPLVLPPNVPEKRVAAWQQAFMALADDPEFKADMAGQKIEFDLMSGSDVAKTVKQITSSPDPLVKRMKTLVGENP